MSDLVYRKEVAPGIPKRSLVLIYLPSFLQTTRCFILLRICWRLWLFNTPKLNNHVVSVFHQHKVPAISVPVFGLWSKRHGKVTCENVPLISRLLRDGMIPILHGDVIYDDSKGDMTILSGDTIVQVLCNELKPDRVLFISDVEGIYDKPPHIPGAQLLSEILVKADGTLKHNVATDVKGFDVTGGIRKKINSACEIVKTDPSLKVYICDFHEDTLNSILTKGLCSKCHGTVIQYEHSNETECS